MKLRKKEIFDDDDIMFDEKPTGQSLSELDLQSDRLSYKNNVTEQMTKSNIKPKNAKGNESTVSNSTLFTNNVIGSSALINQLFEKMFDINELAIHLSETIDKIAEGELSCVEEMLVTQAKTLERLVKNTVSNQVKIFLSFKLDFHIPMNSCA